MQEVVASGKRAETKAEEQVHTKAVARELPWIMPATHGDPTASFFDLPAANLMPHIIPNSSKPMRSDQVRALHLTAGPADESLVNAMKDFLEDVKSINDPYAVLDGEDMVLDIDEMGQTSYTNEAGDVVGDTYYGWSRAFCEKMKRRGKDNGSSGQSRSSSRSKSRSRSRSRSPVRGRGFTAKRKRYSRSGSRSRSSSYGRDHSPRRLTSAALGASSSRTPSLQSLPAAPPARFQTGPQFSHTGPHSLPPPAPFNLPPYQTTHIGAMSPARPPNWPLNVPWPPPPPPPLPPQNFGPHAYGRR